MLKQILPTHLKNYAKSVLNWKDFGEFRKSMTRFADHRGLQVKRFFLVPIWNIRNPVHFRRERSLFRQIISSNNKEIFTVERSLGFNVIELDKDQISACVEFAKDKLLTSKGNSKNPNDKEYLRAIADFSDVDIKSKVFQLFTSPSMLQSVAKYLGSAPILSDIVVLHSPQSDPKPEKTEFQGSQLYHRDGDGVRVLKIWVLCNNVEMENGPTVLLPSHLSDKVAAKHFYRPGDKVSHDRWFKKYDEELFYAVGQAGTALATDTISCFHMGSRTGASSSRLVMMAHYVTPYSSYYRPNSALKLTEKYNFQSSFPELPKSAKILLRPYIANFENE
jgi:hypothetical protein